MAGLGKDVHGVFKICGQRLPKEICGLREIEYLFIFGPAQVVGAVARLGRN
jgi:hypothetical protein